MWGDVGYAKNTARQPLHIAMFLSAFWGGGAQRRMLTLARAFAERGHRIDVVVVCSNGPFRRHVSPLVHVVDLNSSWCRLPAIQSKKGLWVMAATHRLARYLRTAQPDVLLSTSNPANLSALWARRLAHVSTPIVVSVNVHLSGATGERQAMWAPLLRALVCRFYPMSDAIIAISRGVADDLARFMPALPQGHLTTIYNPVAIDEIQRESQKPVNHPWLAPGSLPLVLGVGKFKIQKDFPTLLKAFKRVRDRLPAHLILLGEGGEQANIEKLGRTLGIREDMDLPGFVDNPFAWMAGASVFVLSSAWEGFSNVLVEALACGCPVVSTDCCSGPAEILEGGVYGPLVPVGDDRALAEAILSVLQNPLSRECLRRRAENFSVDASAERYLEVLQRVAHTTDDTSPPPLPEMSNHVTDSVLRS